jgi:hypothetical protein
VLLIQLFKKRRNISKATCTENAYIHNEKAVLSPRSKPNISAVFEGFVECFATEVQAYPTWLLDVQRLF